MRKRTLRFLLVAVSVPALVTIASDAATQEQRRGVFRNIVTTFRPPSPEEEKTIAARLELDESQKQQIKALNERYRSDSSTLVAKYGRAYDDVVALVSQEKPNKKSVNDRLRAFHSVHEELVSREVGYYMDFKSILTIEQNKEFWNIFEQNRVRRGDGGAGNR